MIRRYDLFSQPKKKKKNGFLANIEISGKNWIDEEMEERDHQEIRKHVAYVLRNILVARTEPPRLTTIHPFGSGRGVGEQPRICPVAGPGHRRRKGIGCVYLKNDLT